MGKVWEEKSNTGFREVYLVVESANRKKGTQTKHTKSSQSAHKKHTQKHGKKPIRGWGRFSWSLVVESANNSSCRLPMPGPGREREEGSRKAGWKLAKHKRCVSRVEKNTFQKKNFQKYTFQKYIFGKYPFGKYTFGNTLSNFWVRPCLLTTPINCLNGKKSLGLPLIKVVLKGRPIGRSRKVGWYVGWKVFFGQV